MGRDVESLNNYPLKLKREWDDMKVAADLIKSGQGRIVKEKVKGKAVKYTVRK